VQHSRSLAHVLRLNVMRDVDYTGQWSDPQDHSLHDANVVVGEAKIGGKGDDGHWRLAAWAL
jgi:hypothetical protein